MLIEHQPWQFVSEQCPARALGRDPGGGGYPGPGSGRKPHRRPTHGRAKQGSVGRRTDAPECGVGFRQLRTCRRTRPGQPCATASEADSCSAANNALDQVFSSRLSSSKKRQSVPSARILVGAALINPDSRSRSAWNRMASAASYSRHFAYGICLSVCSA